MNFHKLSKHIQNPKRVLDIGANMGDFSRMLHHYYPACEFILNEANPYLEDELSKLPFYFEIKPLSNSNGNREFFYERINPFCTGASFYKENTEWYDDGKFEIITLPTSTLDSCNYFSNQVIDLKKIDVQGSELDILQGEHHTLSRTKFVLIECSLLPYNHNAPLMDVVLDYLQSIGFDIVDILEYHKTTDRIFQMDVLLKNHKF
jgi:FkbM family methyltransferase